MKDFNLFNKRGWGYTEQDLTREHLLLSVIKYEGLSVQGVCAVVCSGLIFRVQTRYRHTKSGDDRSQRNGTPHAPASAAVQYSGWLDILRFGQCLILAQIFSRWQTGHELSHFSGKQYTELCFWKHVNWEIDNAATEPRFIFDQHGVAWRFGRTFVSPWRCVRGTTFALSRGLVLITQIQVQQMVHQLTAPYPSCTEPPDHLASIENEMDLST